MDDLGKKIIITILILMAVIAASLFYFWYFWINAARQVIREDFEEGFGDWFADADVPLDPNNPGHYVEWSITRSTDVASSGQYSLKFFINGLQDDGTIWIERRILVREGAQVEVSISFDFYSDSESFNTIAVVCAYAGAREPRFEEDFTVIGNANEVKGWKRYDYTVKVNAGSSGEIWVALGISVRWETYMAYFIDNVEVRIT